MQSKSRSRRTFEDFCFFLLKEGVAAATLKKALGNVGGFGNATLEHSALYNTSEEMGAEFTRIYKSL